MRQCTANSKEIEEFYLQTERQLKKWKTEPGLARLWLEILRGNEGDYRGTEQNTQWINSLKAEQKTLGNNQMWTGFISQKWGDIQEAFHRRENHKQEYTGKRWATNLVHSLWTLAMGLWKKRVQLIHRANQTVTPHRKSLITKIWYLYSKIGKTPHILSGLFKHDVRKLIGKPTKYLMRWLRIAQRVPLNETVSKQTRKQLGQDIRKYLPMATHPPNATEIIHRK